ncbi:MAG TPA: response regulator [Chthoniobacterales bacterium]|jgi:FixJ family two-component response regulator
MTASRFVAARSFNSGGYAGEMFASAEDYLARQPFDGPTCLVLDVRMPGLNGLDLQKVIEVRETGEHITGHNDVPICSQALRNGAVDFLMKPFDDTELIESVQRGLARAREIQLLDVGRDIALRVSEDYPEGDANRFTGKIGKMTIETK